jgi:HAD superfamily hydrolase (TIGR01450 family)
VNLRNGPHHPIQYSARERLRAVRGFIFDLDGTLVLGDRRNRGLTPLPGALEIVRWAAGRGLPFVAYTNGTMRSPQGYGETLRAVGFDVRDDAILTPASSAVDVFLRRGHRRVLAMGGNGLTQPLREAGIEVTVPDEGPAEVDAVLVGWYPDFTIATLDVACQAVWAGAAVYTSTQTMFFATLNGRAIGTSRAISAMLKSLTGCRVELVGKPALAALRAAAGRLGLRPDELAVVGDDPELEVPMAHRGRALAIAVGSGLGSEDDYALLPPDRRPHLFLRGVDELLSLCREELP